jgi:hypothetical protein
VTQRAHELLLLVAMLGLNPAIGFIIVVALRYFFLVLLLQIFQLLLHLKISSDEFVAAVKNKKGNDYDDLVLLVHIGSGKISRMLLIYVLYRIVIIDRGVSISTLPSIFIKLNFPGTERLIFLATQLQEIDVRFLNHELNRGGVVELTMVLNHF